MVVFFVPPARGTSVQMVLFTELVCRGCAAVLTYPVGAISCRCQRCNLVNAAQMMAFDCPTCSRKLLLPVTTIEALCPACTTVIDIPIELLPIVPTPAPLRDGRNGGASGTGAGGGGSDAEPATSKYVQGPPSIMNGRAVPSMSIATQMIW